jgi:hypothetical protein
LTFFRDEEAAIIAELTDLDLDSYDPSGAIEVLAPKGKYGFRLVHQLPAIDSVILLAAVCEIGKNIENIRIGSKSICSFSYRYVSNKDGGIFRVRTQLEYCRSLV